MGLGQTQCTYYVPQLPRTIDQLQINLTQLEQTVYNRVIASADLAHMDIEFQAMAHATI